MICRFFECDNDSVDFDNDEFLEHCETIHSKQIHEIDNKNQLTFQLSELVDFDNKILKPIQWLLNCGEDGCYWLILNLNVSTVMEWGMLMGDVYDAVGYSKFIEFTLKIGEKCKDLAFYKSGLIKSMSVQMSTEFFIHYLDIMDFEMIAHTKCTIYLGPMDDSDDDWVMDKNNIIWNENNKAINKKYVEMFTCKICFEYIKSDVICCANKHKPHLYCANCFDRIIRKKCFCDNQFNYDGEHERWEKVAKLIKFPDDSDDNNNCDDDGSPPIDGTLFANRNVITIKILPDDIPDNGESITIILNE